MKRKQIVQVRLVPDEKEGFRQAAEIAGVSLSAWIRERLRLAAIRELEAVGRKVPFVSPVPLRSPHA